MRFGLMMALLASGGPQGGPLIVTRDEARDTRAWLDTIPTPRRKRRRHNEIRAANRERRKTRGW